MRAANLGLLYSNLHDTYARLVVEGYDLTSRLGYNPVITASWTAAADQLATTGQIGLMRGNYADRTNLSAYVSNSLFGPVPIRAGQHFAIETATVAKGSAPAGWEKVWDGRIDGADSGGEQVVLTCRDMMGCFLNRVVEPDAPPETPDGKNGFLVASAPLGTHLATVRAAVYPPGSGIFIEQEVASKGIVGLGEPDWTVVDTWVPYGNNLAEQLNQAVLQRGWAFHYRYTPSTPGAYIYYDPERDTPTANYTVLTQEVIRVLKCTINDQDVTNAWDLIWGEGAARTRTRLVDSTSIANYGRRYGSLPEDASSQIDTLAEAERMLLAMIADTKDPIVELDYERLYFWPVELADKHLMTANFLQADVNFDLAVVGYTHTIGPKAMRTVIRTRGTAIAARRRWYRGQPRKVHVSLDEPVGIAPEGAIWLQVDDLTPPA